MHCTHYERGTEMKKLFPIAALLSVMIMATQPPSLFAQNQNQISCCCNMTCNYTRILNGQDVSLQVEGCNVLLLLPKYNCEPDKICKQFKYSMGKTYVGYVGTCSIDCPSQTVLGENHQGLDTLRRFRDRELAKTDVGNKLKALYYDYATPLTQVFMENPSLDEHAKELLEKLIPRIRASMKGRLKGPVLDADLYAEAEMLLDEIDSVLTSPLKKDLMALKDDARAAGLVE